MNLINRLCTITIFWSKFTAACIYGWCGTGSYLIAMPIRNILNYDLLFSKGRATCGNSSALTQSAAGISQNRASLRSVANRPC